MTQLKPEHTAIAVCIVASAYIAGSALSPIKASKATDCNTNWMGQVTRDVQQAVGLNREPQPGEQIGTYFDVRTKRDEPMYQPGGQPQAFAPADPAPPSTSASTPLPPTQAPIAVPSAVTPRNTVPQSAYQGLPAPPPQIAVRQKSVMEMTPAELEAEVAEVEREFANGTYPGVPAPQKPDARGNVAL